MSDTPQIDVKNCPLCGALSVAPIPSQYSTLLAVCDVLVLKALEALGRRIVREERGRFAELGTRPFHEAHTQWRPGVRMLNRTLDGAWEVVPALLNTHYRGSATADELSSMLSQYVITLVQHKAPHEIELLTTRFARAFNLELSTEGEPHVHRA